MHLSTYYPTFILLALQLSQASCYRGAFVPPNSDHSRLLRRHYELDDLAARYVDFAQQEAPLRARSVLRKRSPPQGSPSGSRPKTPTPNPDGRYSCTHPGCAITFIDKKTLKNHVTRHGDKTLKCSVCTRMFHSEYELKAHMRTHTGERPYACESCDFKTTTKSSLEAHMRTHTGERPYACESCDFKATTKSSLQRHVRTHTGEKPYTCQYCGKAFNDKSNLNRHQMSQHKDAAPVAGPSGEGSKHKDAPAAGSLGSRRGYLSMSEMLN